MLDLPSPFAGLRPSLRRHAFIALLLGAAAALSSCGGGGDSPAATNAPAVTVGPATRGFAVSWTPVAGATRYEVLLDPDGPGPEPATPAGTTAGTSLTLTDIPLHKCVNATLAVRACSGTTCGTASAAAPVDLTKAIGYVKASNTRTDARFGSSLALSGDGNVLAVGSWYESSGATGIGGNQLDTSAPDAGAVYLFRRTAGLWSQEAYVKASNARANAIFGFSVALSQDGTTLAVGALRDSSAANGINGNEADTTAPSAGAAYVFVRSAGTWSQQAYVKASNTGANDEFGAAVALSSDGSTLAVSAQGESSSATGINGNEADNAAGASGAAYVFARAGTTWSQQAYIKASNTRAFTRFGISLALAGDGNLLAVGADGERSNATGVNGNQANTSMSFAGAVYAYSRVGATWSQDAYIKASNTRPTWFFGRSVALSRDGSTLAVGATGEASNATGVNGNQADASLQDAGAVYVFRRPSGSWVQDAYVKASNTLDQTYFGESVALSDDGATLVVGSSSEGSSARGVGGNQSDTSMPGSGAAYVFTRSSGAWSQLAYLKPSNTQVDAGFGYSAAISSDGALIAIGSSAESGGTSGIGGDQADMSAPSAGAVYLY